MVTVVLKDLDRYLWCSTQAETRPEESLMRVFEHGRKGYSFESKDSRILAATKRRMKVPGTHGRAWTLLGIREPILMWESGHVGKFRAEILEKLYASGHLEGRIEDGTDRQEMSLV